MSERFQKTYISVREFVDSWDKELYELNNLDFFIYLLINHLGNQLERQFFRTQNKNSELYLEFDHIGTLSFNLGDALEFFLEENCLGSCTLNCPLDMNGFVSLQEEPEEERIKRKIELLKTYFSDKVSKEQCLRLDLMNHVVLDTLLEFYDDEFHLELSDSDRSVLEMAEFIENVMIAFFQNEGQALLRRPFDTALDYFEELMQSEEDETDEPEWHEEKAPWDTASEDDWQKSSIPIEEVFLKFTGDSYYNPPQSNQTLVHDIGYLHRYLREYAQVENISEFTEHHLAEFFSIWLTREFVLADEKEISHIYRATARFITFLYHKYQINLKREFLQYYEKVKMDLPRIIQATNLFISDFDLFDVIFSAENEEYDHIDGFFEILDTSDRENRYLNVEDIRFGTKITHVKFNSGAYYKIRRGDILHANLVKKTNDWEILDIQHIYPNLARHFLFH